jgi:hypothetical protein
LENTPTAISTSSLTNQFGLTKPGEDGAHPESENQQIFLKSIVVLITLQCFVP